MTSGYNVQRDSPYMRMAQSSILPNPTVSKNNYSYNQNPQFVVSQLPPNYSNSHISASNYMQPTNLSNSNSYYGTRPQSQTNQYVNQQTMPKDHKVTITSDGIPNSGSPYKNFNPNHATDMSSSQAVVNDAQNFLNDLTGIMAQKHTHKTKKVDQNFGQTLLDDMWKKKITCCKDEKHNESNLPGNTLTYGQQAQWKNKDGYVAVNSYDPNVYKANYRGIDGNYSLFDKFGLNEVKNKEEARSILIQLSETLADQEKKMQTDMILNKLNAAISQGIHKEEAIGILNNLAVAIGEDHKKKVQANTI